MQVFGVPYQGSYHQSPSTQSWSSAPPVIGRPGHAMQNPCIGTPVASSSGYNNQLRYDAEHRERQHEGKHPSHNGGPLHNPPQGQPFNSQHRHVARDEFYRSSQFRDPGHEVAQDRRPSEWTPPDERSTQPGRQRYSTTSRDSRGGRVTTSRDKEDVVTPTAPSRLGRRHSTPTSNAYTPSGPGTLRFPHDSRAEPVAATSNSSNPLNTNTSKSSPPYTLSQRKQLRLEEKSYLKEVKRSIAEGRVPRVQLVQDNNGNIVQYKSQFLNALKLAALAIEPNADIDIHDPFTLQEIMKEVERQFIIEKQLPDGFVAGFLQRLYKRNRAVYHRHWTLHGDNSKPDDCSLAAWSQLVDYWKSMEGNKECERNRTNASAKKRLL